MDNHYVPNLTIGPLVCSAIRAITQAAIDVYLMVKPVDRIITDFAKAGANIRAIWQGVTLIAFGVLVIGLIDNSCVSYWSGRIPTSPVMWCLSQPSVE